MVLGSHAHALASADKIATLISSLAIERSPKVRVQAAVLIARTEDPRAVGALVTAASYDPDPLVRAVALNLLAANPGGDPTGRDARKAIRAAFDDRAPKVRRAARLALKALDRKVRTSAAAPVSAVASAPASARGGPLRIVVGRMGDRSGQASAPIRDRLRREILGNLRTTRRVQVAETADEGVAYVVDGTIRRLALSQGATDVELAAQVDLVLSKPPRGILMVASGEAVVLRPRHLYRAEHKGNLEEEALAHAARSAHENLAAFLARDL
jgi:hypothetical protein